MSEHKLSAADVLQPVARSLRRIEGELSTIAQVIEKMVQRIEENRLRSEPVSGKGPSPVAAPGAS
jgi:hypothetical protein